MPSSRRTVLVSLCALVTVAVVSPAGADHDAELGDLESVLEAFHAASPETRLMLLAAGLAMVDEQYGWEEDCQDALEAYARAPYDIRRTQIVAARDGCPSMCPSEEAQAELFLRLVGLPQQLKTGAVASACDAAGFAPVFAGDLAPLRAQMSLEEFWVFRAGFDLLRRRLDTIGGERAATLQSAYDEILPAVAAQLGLFLPPPELALRLPATTALRDAQAASAVGVTASAITLDGRAVGDIVDGAVASDQLDGRDITPLAEAYTEAPETLLVQMDRDLPAAVLVQVMATAGRAGTMQFELAGLSADGGQAVNRISLPDLSRYLGTTGLDSELPPLNLVVSVDEEGFEVLGSADVLMPRQDPHSATLDGGPDSIRLPREAGAFTYAALTGLLERVKDEYPDEESVILVLADDLPYHVVIATLDACRDRGGSSPDRIGALFPYAVIAAGATPVSQSEVLLGPDGLVPPGHQAGFGGLGSRGSGLGGLGSQGLGQTGYSTGGGHFSSSSTGPGTAPGQPVVLGALSKDAIDAEIKKHLAQIRYCYQRELTAQPDLSGKLVVKFVISKDGTISSASVKETTLNHPDLEACVVGRIQAMTFPEPKGGGIVIVSYPFLFRPAE